MATKISSYSLKKLERVSRKSQNYFSIRHTITYLFRITENIKVRFFEVDENDEPIWEDWGRFSEVDVHHQYAIGKLL